MSRQITKGDIVRDVTGRQGEVIDVMEVRKFWWIVVKFDAFIKHYHRNDKDITLVVRAEDRPVWAEDKNE